MKDLIDKTRSIARMAGQMDYAQSRLAKRVSRIGFLLAWIAIGMAASVGAAYFSPYEFSDPMIAAFVAIGAAVFGIMTRISRVNIRITEHRVAQTQFRRIRQDSEMLLLKLRGGDLSRAEGLAAIETLNSTLCDLIAKTAHVSNRMLKRAGKAFDRLNPEIRQTVPVIEPEDFLRAPRPAAGRK